MRFICAVFLFMILSGCICESEQCAQECPKNNLPISISGLSGGYTFYWIRTDTNWVMLDSVRIDWVYPHYSDTPFNAFALDELFASVPNFEDFNYLLVNEVLQTSDSLSNLIIERSSSSSKCCREKLVCEDIDYLEFNFNGQQLALNDFPFSFAPD